MFTDLENLQKSGNLKQNSKSQGIRLKSQGNGTKFRSHGKVREFYCKKFTFSQFEDPNFETFLGKHVPTPLVNAFGITVKVNLSLEK